MTKMKTLPATPTKEQTFPLFAIAVGSSVDSFYRSSLNALLIAQLTGKPAAWFPNMHLQIPTRVAYIAGFKWLRHVIDNKVDITQYKRQKLTKLGLALMPGIIMTPVIGVLEATNVSHLNNEPIMKRWTRGLIPRGVREVMYGLGINQLSDICESRVEQVVSNPIARNFAGSFLAGSIAGYLSHVPHNLSTLKLVEPQKSYGELFAKLREPYTNWYRGSIGKNVAPNSLGERVTSFVGTLLFPKGCLIRTMQISGSFIIINATINLLKGKDINVLPNYPQHEYYAQTIKKY